LWNCSYSSSARRRWVWFQFHSLRHFCATTLMSNGVDPQAVQKMLRHANLRVTLETYVHWLPKKGRPRGVIGSVLTKANQERQKPRKIA